VKVEKGVSRVKVEKGKESDGGEGVRRVKVEKGKESEGGEREGE
jgi:hypothetical protein